VWGSVVVWGKEEKKRWFVINNESITQKEVGK
jgi:hypothetical protein